MKKVYFSLMKGILFAWGAVFSFVVATTAFLAAIFSSYDGLTALFLVFVIPFAIFFYLSTLGFLAHSAHAFYYGFKHLYDITIGKGLAQHVGRSSDVGKSSDD